MTRSLSLIPSEKHQMDRLVAALAERLKVLKSAERPSLDEIEEVIRELDELVHLDSAVVEIDRCQAAEDAARLLKIKQETDSYDPIKRELRNVDVDSEGRVIGSNYEDFAALLPKVELKQEISLLSPLPDGYELVSEIKVEEYEVSVLLQSASYEPPRSEVRIIDKLNKE